MKQRVCALIRMDPPEKENVGLLFASGTVVPTAASAGYSTSCIFQHTDGGAGTVLYVNEGSATSCSFQPIAALSAAQEALLGAPAGTATASKAVILDANVAVDAVNTAALSIGASGAEVAITATPAELNLLDTTTSGTVVASKALAVGADKNLDVLAVADLKLGSGAGTSVTATAAELNVLDAVTAGTVTASKGLVVDANSALDVVNTATLSLGASGSEVAVTATAAEINQLDGAILANMSAGAGVSTGTGTVCQHRVTKVGDLFKTEIFLDITGLNDGGAGVTVAVVGKDAGTANCHIGQILAAVNGTIIAGYVHCLIAPATGHADIDLWTANEGTLAQDSAIGDATANVQLVQAATWAAGDIIALTAFPPANDYLILAMGTAGSDADYTDGTFIIELWGV